MNAPGAHHVAVHDIGTRNPPPDWQSIHEEILCPLCDYNLRGLVEPRCPECGHHFVWAEALDRSRLEHPWLFEHSRLRKFYSLLNTFSVSQFPGRFWKSVRPMHAPNVDRLVIYWLLLSLVAIVPIGVFRFSGAIDYYVNLKADRQRIRTSLESAIRANHPAATAAVKQAGSVEALVRSMRPIIPQDGSLQSIGRASIDGRIVWLICLGAIIWPWVTFLSLLVFLRTMRKAQIKIAHVLRCAIYSSDTAFLLIIPVATLILWSSGQNWYFRIAIDQGMILVPFVAMIIPFGAATILTWRLKVAYQHYLGFPHAGWVSIASQLIVLLALLAIAPIGWLI